MSLKVEKFGGGTCGLNFKLYSDKELVHYFFFSLNIFTEFFVCLSCQRWRFSFGNAVLQVI